jgi:hypothetical protein
MRISETGQKIVMHRYGGLNDGKSIMAKIGDVPVGTKPDEIPDDLKQNLTPRELSELVEHLKADQVRMATQKVDVLVQNLQEMLSSAKAGVLSQELVKKLDSSASEFTKQLRRITAVKKFANPESASS